MTLAPAHTEHAPPADAGIEELFRTHYDCMVRLATRELGVRAVAEELVQDAYMKVHAHWDDVLVPSVYLRTCVVNACRTWHRREARARCCAARSITA